MYIRFAQLQFLISINLFLVICWLLKIPDTVRFQFFKYKFSTSIESKLKNLNFK